MAKKPEMTPEERAELLRLNAELVEGAKKKLAKDPKMQAIQKWADDHNTGGWVPKVRNYQRHVAEQEGTGEQKQFRRRAPELENRHHSRFGGAAQRRRLGIL